MKKTISIATRLHPFSHRPGIKALVPGTAWEVEVFPTLLNFRKGEELVSQPVPLKGPFDQFTVEVDLEKAQITVFGVANGKYFRYQVDAPEKPHIVPNDERCSFGVHKAQDWDLVIRRQDLTEIFPFWLRAAQLAPIEKGSYELLESAHFLSIFKAGFRGILSPRLNDEEYQGLLSTKGTGSPLYILTESAKMIRSLFFQEKKDELVLLPHVPPEFHAGRWINITTEEQDLLSFEWSKKRLRKLLLKPGKPREIALHLPSEVKTFRVRSSFKEKGKVLAKHSPVHLEQNTLIFDRFER